MALSSSSHQAIDDLVKLLVSSSLFSRESERKWAKSFNIVETKNMTEDEQASKGLEDSHFRLITYLRNKILPFWNEDDSKIHSKIKQNVNKQKVLDESLSTALLWVDRSHDTIGSTQVTYLELNGYLRTLISGLYLEFDHANKIILKECKETAVFDDFENCRLIPDDKDKNFYDTGAFVANIKATLKDNGVGCEGATFSVTAVGNSRSFHRDPIIAKAIALSFANQSVIYHEARNTICVPDTGDKRMIVSVISFMHTYLRKYNEGCVVVLCTSDLDFLGTIMELKRHNFYVILVHNEHEANPKLTRAADRCFLWHKFIRRA